jgi:hypothetical protein
MMSFPNNEQDGTPFGDDENCENVYGYLIEFHRTKIADRASTSTDF